MSGYRSLIFTTVKSFARRIKQDNTTKQTLLLLQSVYTGLWFRGELDSCYMCHQPSTINNQQSSSSSSPSSSLLLISLSSSQHIYNTIGTRFSLLLLCLVLICVTHCMSIVVGLPMMFVILFYVMFINGSLSPTAALFFAL